LDANNRWRRIVVAFHARRLQEVRVGMAALAARILLAGVFALAGVSKLMDRSGVRRALAEFGVPLPLRDPMTVALPITEVCIAIGLIPAISARWAAWAAIGLLAVFLSAITLALARGRRPDCRCFGQMRPSPVGPTTLVRNVILAAFAAVVVRGSATGQNPDVLDWVAKLTALQVLAGVIAAVLLAAVVIEGWFVVNLARQQGRLLLRLEALETSNLPHRQGETDALSVGSTAPAFGLDGLYGETLTLVALRAAGRPVLLVFSDPGCASCASLMQQVAEWQDRHRALLTISVISRGHAAVNRTKAEETGLRNVLLQKDFEVAERYGIVGTPSAVLVSVDGSIASPAAVGTEAITALAASVTSAQSGTGTPTGLPAPDFTLSDNQGNAVSLRGYRGKRVLLLFWNPSCGFCAQMLDELRAWERTKLRDAPQLIVVSTGTADQNLQMGLGAPVLGDPFNSVAPTFGVNGTPMAVIVDVDGLVTSRPAAGATAVFDLARNLSVSAASAQTAP
jgi:peroxiredoxin/uncharacterized membrane protein YphA (DoxX/SURF4 family)